jgi:CheY-like chemotaxis protein
MVVEDYPFNAMVIKALLTKLEYQVDVYHDGASAVQAIKDGFRPDLILMDLMMPDMDGFTATRLIRAWESETGQSRLPIVAQTAASFDASHEDYIHSEMDGFLRKPLKVEEIAHIIHELCADVGEDSGRLTRG